MKRSQTEYYRCENCPNGTVIANPKGASPLDTASGVALGAAMGSVLPIIGTIVGGLIGAAMTREGGKYKGMIGTCQTCNARYDIKALSRMKEKPMPLASSIK